MLKRIVTGVVLSPIVVVGTWYFPGTFGYALAIVAAGIAGYEFLNMFSLRESRTVLLGGVAWIVLAPVLAGLEASYLQAYLFCTPIFALGMFLLLPERIPKAAVEAPALALGALYVGLLTGAVAMLARLPQWGASGLIMLYAVVWLGDSAAYFGGKFLGKHKLYRRVSPKKTMEGSLFGLAGSIGGAFFVDAVFGTPLSTIQLLLLGFGGGIAEQVGDLCESVLKRSVGIKDSGTILPGHGGMLDRVDGLLFSAPIVWGMFVIQ